jgi:hypothetical protein
MLPMLYMNTIQNQRGDPTWNTGTWHIYSIWKFNQEFMWYPHHASHIGTMSYWYGTHLRLEIPHESHMYFPYPILMGAYCLAIRVAKFDRAEDCACFSYNNTASILGNTRISTDLKGLEWLRNRTRSRNPFDICTSHARPLALSNFVRFPTGMV